jgi:hypothetical protein
MDRPDAQLLAQGSFGNLLRAVLFQQEKYKEGPWHATILEMDFFLASVPESLSVRALF